MHVSEYAREANTPVGEYARHQRNILTETEGRRAPEDWRGLASGLSLAVTFNLHPHTRAVSNGP